MDWKGRFAAFGVVAAALLAIEDMLVPAIALPLLVLAIALAWRFTEGFWRTVAYGLVGGAIAGLLIMGPGFRLAMRVVAIMDSARTPEFSIEGTFFFIIGIGGIFGALISAFGNLIRKSAQVTSVAVAGVVLGTVQMIMLLGDPGLRQEFFELGAGPWLNIPMFGLIALGYGVAAMRIAGLLEHKANSREVVAREDVPV